MFISILACRTATKRATNPRDDPPKVLARDSRLACPKRHRQPQGSACERACLPPLPAKERTVVRRVGVPAAEAALHVQLPGPAIRRGPNFSLRLRDTKPHPETPMIQRFVF